jgi:hypothetical protein
MKSFHILNERLLRGRNNILQSIIDIFPGFAVKFLRANQNTAYGD